MHFISKYHCPASVHYNLCLSGLHGSERTKQEATPQLFYRNSPLNPFPCDQADVESSFMVLCAYPLVLIPFYSMLNAAAFLCPAKLQISMPH
jgi:hypothetical protein